ncbi:MAG: GNAT family N-acetyltransferase [Armatimonadota bacterium]
MGVVIRSAQVSDAHGIASVIRGGFEKTLINTTIYGGHNIEKYIQYQISNYNSKCDTVFTIADDNSKVVGAVEMRRLVDGLFLNYISVLQCLQSAGIGKRLLKYAIDSILEPNYLYIGLDVLVDNEAAKSWYRKLGFEQENKTTWYEVTLGNCSKHQPALVNSYAQALVSYNSFGFGSFNITTPSASYIIGMLGPTWFRLTDPSALNDSSVVSSLQKLDPRRRLLVLCQEDLALQLPGARTLAQTERMSADIQVVLSRLSQ